MTLAPAAAARSKIPVTIVTGFLGSGKTTLIRHVIERAAVVARGAEITPEDLWLGDAAPEEETPFPTLDELEKGHIREALHRCGGNTKEAAELLNIARSTLYRKITEYNLES